MPRKPERPGQIVQVDTVHMASRLARPSATSQAIAQSPKNADMGYLRV